MPNVLGDLRETWRSLLIRVDEYGKLIWQSVDSFVEENEVNTTASEYIIMSQEGKNNFCLRPSFWVWPTTL